MSTCFPNRRFAAAASLLLAGFLSAQAGVSAAEPLQIAVIKHDGPVDFAKEVLPIFRRNCLACHSATEAQGDLVLESPTTILKGGGEGPAVVAGKSGESLLLKLASHQKEPYMPPPDNDVKAKPLAAEELGLIKLWIDQGAKGDAKATNEKIAWQPLPAGINPVYAVAITPDGQYAAASRANQIFLYHVPSRRELFRLTDPVLAERGLYKQPGAADLDLIQSLRFSPDGTLLASGGFRTVKLWRKSPGGKIADLPEAEAIAALVAQAGHGSVRRGEQAGELKVTLGKEEKTLNHGGPVAVFAASADGTRLVSIGADSRAKLWNVESGQMLAELKGDLRLSLKVAERTRAAALAKKQIELAKKDLEEANKRKKSEEDDQKKSAEALTKAEADLKTKEEGAKKTAGEKTAADKALADATAAKTKADDAKKAAEELVAKADEALKSAKASQAAAAKAAGDEGAAAKAAAEKTVAGLETLRKLLAPGQQAAAKTAEGAAAAFTQTEKKAKDATAAHQKAADEQAAAARTRDTAKRAVERSAESVKKATAAIPGFEALVKKAEEAAKARDAEVAQAADAAKKAEKPLTSVAFSPDGSTVVTSGADGTIHIWDAETGAAREVQDSGVGSPKAMTFADSSKLFIAGGKTAVLWNLGGDWRLERTIGSPDDPSVFSDRVTALDFSPDRQTLAAGSGEPSRSGEIKLFDVASGKLKLTFKEPHSDTVNCLAFSPDGTQLASTAADRFLKLWNAADGKFLRSFEGHTHHVLSAAWRADGRLLISSGADMVLKTWDPRTGDQLRTVQNQFTKEVTSVSLVADDLFVASGGDAKVRVINAANGSSQRDLPGTSEYMYAVATSADGKTIVAGGLDSVVRAWNDEGKELAKFAAPAAPPAVKSQTAAK